MPPLESMWPLNRALAFSRLATYSWESLRLKIRLHGKMNAAYMRAPPSVYGQAIVPADIFWRPPPDRISAPVSLDELIGTRSASKHSAKVNHVQATRACSCWDTTPWAHVIAHLQAPKQVSDRQITHNR